MCYRAPIPSVTTDRVLINEGYITRFEKRREHGCMWENSSQNEEIIIPRAHCIFDDLIATTKTPRVSFLAFD